MTLDATHTKICTSPETSNPPCNDYEALLALGQIDLLTFIRVCLRLEQKSFGQETSLDEFPIQNIFFLIQTISI
jgi:hypothetical protein